MRLVRFLAFFVFCSLILWQTHPIHASPRPENGVERRVLVQVAVFEYLLQEQHQRLLDDVKRWKQGPRQGNKPKDFAPFFFEAPYRSQIVGASPLVLWNLERRGWGKWIIPRQNSFLINRNEDEEGIWRKHSPSLEFLTIQAIFFTHPDEAKVFVSYERMAEYQSVYDGSSTDYLFRLRQRPSGWRIEDSICLRDLG